MKNVLAILFFTLGISLSTHANTITIAHQNNYPPYASIGKSGEPQGVLIDWWKLWATKTGTNVKFVNGTTDECVKMVLDGDADILAGSFIQDDSVRLNYSEFIMRVSTTVFLKKGQKPQSVHAIKDPVGVMKDELSHKVITEMFPDLKVKIFDTIEDLRLEIINKTIAAFVYEIPNPFAATVSFTPPEGYYMFHSIRSDKIRPAVKHGNEDIMLAILKGSANISDDELIEIAKNNNLFKNDTNYSWAIVVLALVVMTSFIVFVYKQRKSKKQAGQIADYEAKDWQTIINKGETDKIEFKSSLRWDYRQEKVNQRR